MEEKIRVFIVEDIEILRNHFVEMVQESDKLTVVGSAGNCREALELMDDSAIDILLTDIEMETKSSGIELARHTQERWPEIHIVFLTVHDKDTIVYSAFENGAVDYILKTSPSEEIVESIILAYENRSPIRPYIAEKIRAEFSRIRSLQTNLDEIMDVLLQLTPAEKNIISMLLKGKKISTIAEERFVEITTIKSQINTLLKKFNKRRTKQITSLLVRLKIDRYFLE